MGNLRFRRVVSLTSLTAFALLSLSGIVLYLTPQGRVAYWADWRLWGLGKEAWTSVHINLALLFLVASGFHLYENWGPLTAYLKDRRKRLVLFTGEFTLSLALAGIFAAGTLAVMPPFSTVLSLGDAIKARHAEVHGEPPYGHAELSTLTAFAKRTGLDPDRALALLRSEGLAGVSGDATLLSMAEANGLSPQQLYELIREAAATPAAPEGDAPPPRPGLGRLAVSEAAESYNFNVKTALSRLAAQGVRAVPETTLKEAAERTGMTPYDVLLMLVK